MTHYPLLFGFRDLVAGRGFLAGVSVHGRALLVQDDEEGYWMHGINPGGLSAGGADTGEAQRVFRETYRTILFDISAGSKDFDEFRAEVERFFNGVSDQLLTKWSAAVQQVRAGEVHADWLRRVSSDGAKVEIDVVPLTMEELEPTVNEPDEEPALAAA